jgi:nicotinamide mononucleotide (NMN) deamidase PncC
VGLVFIATAVNGETAVHRSILPGDRSEVRSRAAQAALLRLLRALPAGKKGGK